MTNELDSVLQLLVRRLRQELTAAEAEELRRWAESSSLRAQLEKELSEPRSVAEVIRSWEQYDDTLIAQRLTDRFPGLHLTARVEVVPPRVVHRVHFLKTIWFRVAAAVLLFAGIGAYLWLQPSTDKADITHTKPAPIKNDILPGKNRAMLTLSTGQQVILDSTASEIIQDRTLSIENNNGQLIYKKGDLVATNTMTTPKGGQYQLTLADGTKVWLNAASSITYPTAFRSNTREVTITGEAYFEVVKNPSKPFVVKTPKEDITVLGTSFNVNAYEEEEAMKTSLLDGVIKIGDTFIKPGQAYRNGKVQPTDVQRDIAWKNGAFDFTGMDLRAVFRQLERWYNVEVRYEGKLPSAKPAGQMGRDFTLSQVLRALKKIGINTRLEQNILTVLPN